MTSLLINFDTFSQRYLRGRLVSYGGSVIQHTLVHPVTYRGSLVQSLFFQNQTGHCRPVFNSAYYLLLQFFFLSFRFKVEQWLILAILVFVLVILFARVCRVISRPLCHDTLSCYCGTIVYGYIGLSCPCFPPFSRTFGSGYTFQTLLPSGSGQSIAWRRYILPGQLRFINYGMCLFVNMCACIFSHMQRNLSPRISQFSCLCLLTASIRLFSVSLGSGFLSPGIMSLVLRTCPSCLG